MKKNNIVSLDIDNVKIKINMQGFSYVRDKSGTTVHSHVNYEIHVVLKGTTFLEIDEETITLNANDVVIISPSVFHKFVKADCESSVLSFSFSVKNVKRTSDRFEGQDTKLQNCGKWFLLQNETDISTYIFKTLAALHSSNNFAEEQIRAYLTLTFIQIFNGLNNGIDKNKTELELQEYGNRIYIIDDYFNEHYMEKISLKELSEILYLGERQTNRIIKSTFGTGFNERLTVIRIKSAIELLENTDFTIETIAEKVGYDSYNGFYSAFKKKTGISPSIYRQNVLRSK